LVVCNPVANGEYKKKKTDKLDARKLAKLLRGNFLTPVYHDGSAKEQLRVIMSAYEDLVGDAVRLKNRYKSLFRKEGKGNRIKGGALYKDESLLEGLERKDRRFIGERLYKTLEFMESERAKYVEEILRVSKKFEEIKNLKSLPGIGDLQAAKILAQIIEPMRFRNKYKYYSYCGLVRHMRSSGGKDYGSVKIWGNKSLKCVYKMAAHSILRGESELRRYYDSLRTKGVDHKAAKNAVSRKVAAISLHILKNGVRYSEKKLNSNHLK
jgi:transposase